ncbi:hypothetical protein [Tenacibaculum sp. C7A-26P2]|uniref:hypothetical protein n=1 Tax=Tenacibaculum sp. C7A-26P2 TaxID=3447504 RepID=UPI003F8486D2
MEIKQNNNYKLITSEEKTFNSFLNKFKQIYNKIESSHIILEFSSKNNFSEQNILLLLEYAFIQKKKGLSFVIIDNSVDIDKFPEELNIVPTLIEAEDVLEIENIQRNLGF